MSALVIKRDGKITSFDESRIINAMSKAFEAERGEVAPEDEAFIKETAKDIKFKSFAAERKFTVEEIQNMVEERLMVAGYKDVARSYIRYRYKRETVRETYNDLDKEIQGLKDLTSEEVRNNANKAGDKLQTFRPMLSDITSINYAKRHIVPERILKHHGKEIYLHDFNYLSVPMFNCMLVNWEDCFENGMMIGSAPIEKPKSIMTAIALISQLAAHVSSNCYGGITFINLTKGLCQYGKASLNKHRRRAAEWIEGKENQERYSWTMLEDEITKSMQSLEYEIQTLTNSRGEVPFITIELDCIDLNASEEDQKIQYIIITSMLRQRLGGLTNGVTPVFPKICFELKRGNNLEKDDPYYDVFQLAVKCSSIRLYPDYLMHDKIVEVTGGYKAPMSCVDGKEIVTYKIGNDIYVESIERMWNRLADYNKIHVQPNGKDVYMDVNNVDIYDTMSGFVKNNRIVRNKNTDWLRVTLSNGRTITCTKDHPFQTNRGEVLARELEIKDKMWINKNRIDLCNDIQFNINRAWLLGVIICDGCYDNHISVTLNAIGEDDIINKCIEVFKNEYEIRTKIVDRSNDKRRNYKEVFCISDGTNKIVNMMNYLNIKFGGKKKIDRHIPNEVFSWTKEAQLAFMAGMIDADGYINNNRRLTVQIGSTNKELALQQMMLAQQLEMPACVYINHYDKKECSKVRYRVEFVPSDELMHYIISTKKYNHYIEGISNKKSDTVTNAGYVLKIEEISKEGYSYDVTTNSAHFEVSGIYSHNCRSFIPELSDENGNRITGGGFNQGVCSINLPRLAIQANHDENKFYNLLDEALDLTKEALLIRHNMLKTVKAKQAPILYQYGAISRLDPEETIEKLLYKNRSTISVGYVGVHNALIALYGKSFDTDDNMIEKGKQILNYMRSFCEKTKSETNIGFSLYSTPAEILATKFCKADIQEFGIIPNVNDRGYYENSFHYPSDTNITPFKKIDIESKMSYIPSGGAIQYTEFGNMIHNPIALETIIKYAYDKCHYFGVNVSSDRCFKCNYVGEMISLDETNNYYQCPQCGNTDNSEMSVIRRLCGYLGSLSERQSVDNKMKEINHRVKHFKGSCGDA